MQGKESGKQIGIGIGIGSGMNVGRIQVKFDEVLLDNVVNKFDEVTGRTAGGGSGGGGGGRNG